MNNGGSGELSGIFSVVLNRSGAVSWPSFGVSGGRSLWTKYCLLCTVCGSAATILASFFLLIAALFRHYTTSIHFFETVPTYVPAILLSICGVSTIAFSCKRNRNIILLRITACWSLMSAALSSVITITTSLIHMNRLQTLKECAFNPSPPMSCTCFSHPFNIDGHGAEQLHFVFENTPDCEVIHGILYSCLRAVFAISVVAVLLSIFLCMLLYQLIGHERKKAYWSRIRRINSDWTPDFIACLSRPMGRERPSMMPLMVSPSPSLPLGLPRALSRVEGWGPPPPYEHNLEFSGEHMILPRLRDHLYNNNNLLMPSTSTSHPFSPTIVALEPPAYAPRQEIPPQSAYQPQPLNVNITEINRQLTTPLHSQLTPLKKTGKSLPASPVLLVRNLLRGYGQFGIKNEKVRSLPCSPAKRPRLPRPID